VVAYPEITPVLPFWSYFRVDGDSTTTQERCNNSAEMTYENWVVNTATIQSCEWKDAPPRTESSLFVGYFIVCFSYIADDKHFSGKFYSSHAWEKGTDLGMLYNPQNPVENCVCDEYEPLDIFDLLEGIDFVPS
jgi:hypothetical protein